MSQKAAASAALAGVPALLAVVMSPGLTAQATEHITFIMTGFAGAMPHSYFAVRNIGGSPAR